MASIFDFEPVEKINSNYQPIYGAFNCLDQSSEDKAHQDLIWNYKQAFQAMSAVEYRNNDEKLFNSPLIQQLKKWYIQQNKRIQVQDFEQIPFLCIPSMLKHSWMFQDFTTNEMMEAILLSIKSKSKQSKNRKENHKFSQFHVLLKIIDQLTKMGHILYPFANITYSQEINQKLAENQIVIMKKCTGIQKKAVNKSYLSFLNHFGIDKLPQNKNELNDLEIIAEILNLTYTQDERFVVLERLWFGASIYKQEAFKALSDSDLNNTFLWDKNITSIIAEYL